MEYNANVHSQEDMNNLGIEGTYMFEEGFWAGKDGFQSYYSEDGGDPVQIVGVLETVNLMGEKPQEGNHVWFSWAATSQPSAQQQNMYMMSDALANWSSNIILTAMGGYASSGLTSSMTMVRSLPGTLGKQAAGKGGTQGIKSLGAAAVLPALANTIKTGTQGFKSLGAAGKGFNKVLQSGGHTLNNSTLKALGLTKQQGKIAIEGLKDARGLPPNFHGKIMGNGDLVHPHTREVLGNLFDYLP